MTYQMPGRCLNICGRLYVLTLGACAIISSVFSIYSCQFFSYRTLDGEPWEGFEPPYDKLTEASVGLFSYSELLTTEDNVLFGDQCMEYPQWSEVGQHKLFYVAQWCSMIAPAAAFLAWFQIFFEMIYCRLRGSFMITSFLFFAASALQGCTFFIFADTNFCFEAESVNQCALKTGAWFSVGSMAAYLILAILAASVPAFPGEVGRFFVITRGEYAVSDFGVDDDNKGQGHIDTSEDDDEEKAFSQDMEDDGHWSYEEASTVNWGATEVAEEEREHTSRTARTNASTVVSDVCLNPTDADSNPSTILSSVAQDKNEVDSFADEVLIQVKKEKLTQNGTSIEDKADKGHDLLDHMCCGDPLELDKYMTPCNPQHKVRSSKHKKRSRDVQMSDAVADQLEGMGIPRREKGSDGDDWVL